MEIATVVEIIVELIPLILSTQKRQQIVRHKMEMTRWKRQQVELSNYLCKDYRSTTATAQPSHSSSLNRFTFNANDHEYGRSSSSIFATVATTPYHHCPPCPVCQHAMNGHQQQKTIENTVNLRIRLGTCNINYEQQVKPRSTIISLTVVVSFHQNLLTKLDRAFRIQCAYTEGSKTIDANLNVSMPPSIEVKSTMNSPHCIYTVKSPSGKVITHARIGELVDHQWICRSLFKGVYAMLVRNCFAESNDNFRVRVIDENGCTLDPYILPNLQYASDLMSAKVRVPVFKFPDHSEISFRCDVLVCMQGKHDCELITPPKCTSDKRKRRNLLNTSRESLILQTLTMNIVDLDYVTPGLESDPLILNPSLHSKPLQYCLTVTRFACFIASATFLITTTATLIGAFIISFNSHHINIFSASDL
ncbi:unnamed protein product [Litomosoides sigmodontis]|uniref:ZP domain-containing protein n=1 Tax=Litomosoides sigmodontis TaxID=42156 RepID=A0A3P6SZW3_LITSI|nr:unnamed protein product [Litomosoides sigmodontis]